jgi:hypothetical protein
MSRCSGSDVEPLVSFGSMCSVPTLAGLLPLA